MVGKGLMVKRVTEYILKITVVMAQAESISQQCLGASLLIRKPNELTVKELKRWLKSIGR